jgi:hypothetical protein
MWDDANALQDLSNAPKDLLLCQLLHGDHPGWILGPSILKAIVFPRLQGLNPAMKIAGDDAKPGQALLFKDLDSIKKWFDLLKVLNGQRCPFPPIIYNWPSI